MRIQEFFEGLFDIVEKGIWQTSVRISGKTNRMFTKMFAMDEEVPIEFWKTYMLQIRILNS